MTVTVLRKGSDSYSAANPAVMTALRLDFAMRYCGMGSGKLLTVAEAQALHAAGFDILLNPELDSSDGSGGFNQGVRYATIANNHADALGAPQTAVLVFSIDADRSADWVRPYFQGIKSVGRRAAGGYGGTEMLAMLNEGLIRVWVQANAGSWSGEHSSNFPTHPRAHFRQHLPVTVNGFNYDPEDQIAPTDQCGFWLSPQSPIVIDIVIPDTYPDTSQEEGPMATATYPKDTSRLDGLELGGDGVLRHWARSDTGDDLIHPEEWPIAGLPNGAQVGKVCWLKWKADSSGMWACIADGAGHPYVSLMQFSGEFSPWTPRDSVSPLKV